MILFDFSDQKLLDDFIRGAADQTLEAGAEFLQSWSWGEILETEGQAIRRLGVRDDKTGEILVAVTLVKKKIIGSYFYWLAPRGPIFRPLAELNSRDSETAKVAQYLLGEIKKLDSRALFLRLEPSRAEDFIGLPFRPSKNLEPALSLILDLGKRETELLKEMHQKTRYNLGLAAKKGIKITTGQAADFPELWRLLSLTSNRDDFRLHAREHYLNLLTAAPGLIKLFFAEYEGRKIAAGLFIFWGDKVTYLHGASDSNYRQLMAPYLLQWSLIKAAKDEAYKYYDFYGIDEINWPGVTRFKLGFGGRRVDYPGTFDFIFCPRLYSFYLGLRRLRRLI